MIVQHLIRLIASELEFFVLSVMIVQHLIRLIASELEFFVLSVMIVQHLIRLIASELEFFVLCFCLGVDCRQTVALFEHNISLVLIVQII